MPHGERKNHYPCGQDRGTQAQPDDSRTRRDAGRTIEQGPRKKLLAFATAASLARTFYYTEYGAVLSPFGPSSGVKKKKAWHQQLFLRSSRKVSLWSYRGGNPCSSQMISRTSGNDSDLGRSALAINRIGPPGIPGGRVPLAINHTGPAWHSIERVQPVTR